MYKNPKYVFGPRDLYVPMHLNFTELILKKMWENRNEVGLIDAQTNANISFGEMAQRAMNFAISLTHIGVRKGDVITICSENHADFLCASIGVGCTGAIIAPISALYLKDEILHVVNISKPKYGIFSQLTYKKFKEYLKEMPFMEQVILFGDEKHENTILYNDLAFVRNGAVLSENVRYQNFQVVDVNGQTDTLAIFCSSGTSGMPKAVMITHCNVIATVCTPSHHEKLLPLMITTWAHVYGYISALKYIIQGWTAVFLNKFDITVYLDTIDKHKISEILVIPTILILALKLEYNLSLPSVESIICAGSPLQEDTIEKIKNRFPNCKGVCQGYGLTEATYVVTLDRGFPDKSKMGTIGVLLPGNVAKIVDTTSGEPLDAGQYGEMRVKGPSIMKGYIGKDRSEYFDEEGFFKTGDLGYYDEDGYFYVVDKIKEIIKYKAYQVPPAEIEAVLLKHEAVKEACVVGVDHEEAGEVPFAFVVLQTGKTATVKELQNFVAEKLSNPKHIRGGVKFLEEIPKTVIAKMDRKRLRNIAKEIKSSNLLSL